MSAKPSSRRHRNNSVGDFHLVISNVAKRDPPSGLVVSVGGSGVGVSIERSAPLVSGVLFPVEEVEIEEVPQPAQSLPAPLPTSYPHVIQYIEPESQRLASPFLSYPFLSMATTRNIVSAVNTTSVQTPLSVEGRGTIAISTITYSDVVFGSGNT